jgi:hypothetical protein
MISLNEHSPNHRLLTFGDGRYEPIHRPALFKCLQQLWERTPARPLGDTFKHSYYIGGRRRWLIDVFVDCLVLVRPLSS